MEPRLITVGEILSSHGLRGEVRVKPATDFPERFKPSEEVYVVGDRVFKTQVEGARAHKDYLILKLAGINDLTAAEKLRGSLLKIDVSKVKKLPAGHYYMFQIIGLRVLTEDGRDLGKVTEVLRTGSNDVYVVGGSAEILLPATREVVHSIDLEKGEMVVRLIPGLLEGDDDAAR